MTTGSPLLRPMLARADEEQHRASTPLELLFDLCFVVAVAAAAAKLHHAEADSHLSSGLVGYAMVFFAIWWAWMNFTWFASAYDNDDVAYRLAVLVMIAGVLILAAGVPRAFDHQDIGIVVVGYVVMRVALVALWLRAAHGDPPRRTSCLTMAVAITVVQLGWIVLAVVSPSGFLLWFLVLVLAELAVPLLAERRGRTPWHPGHISERYGLFTLIVLGESILAGSVALSAAFEQGADLTAVLGVAAGGLLLVFSMWWKYFARTAEVLLLDVASTFRWGYGHLAIFASAAAVGAGLAVAIDQATGTIDLSARAAAAAVTVPAAVYVVTVWALHLRPQSDGPVRGVALGVGVTLMLAATFAPQPVLLAGICAAAMVAVNVVLDARTSQSSPR